MTEVPAGEDANGSTVADHMEVLGTLLVPPLLLVRRAEEREVRPWHGGTRRG